MAYLLDADVFIRAKNLHYGFDFCPAFWEWLIAGNSEGKVFSIEKVGEELVAGNDKLTEWAKTRGPSFFLKPDKVTNTAFTKVSTWAKNKGYEPAAISTFFNTADFFLVSHALADGHIVVTHEKTVTSKRMIKIPNACNDLYIKYMTPFEMLRCEQARFILGPQT